MEEPIAEQNPTARATDYVVQAGALAPVHSSTARELQFD